jgi:hypothetical protein
MKKESKMINRARRILMLELQARKKFKKRKIKDKIQRLFEFFGERNITLTPEEHKEMMEILKSDKVI